MPGKINSAELMIDGDTKSAISRIKNYMAERGFEYATIKQLKNDSSNGQRFEINCNSDCRESLVKLDNFFVRVCSSYGFKLKSGENNSFFLPESSSLGGSSSKFKYALLLSQNVFQSLATSIYLHENNVPPIAEEGIPPLFIKRKERDPQPVDDHTQRRNRPHISPEKELISNINTFQRIFLGRVAAIKYDAQKNEYSFNIGAQQAEGLSGKFMALAAEYLMISRTEAEDHVKINTHSEDLVKITFSKYAAETFFGDANSLRNTIISVRTIGAGQQSNIKTPGQANILRPDESYLLQPALTKTYKEILRAKYSPKKDIVGRLKS